MIINSSSFLRQLVRTTIRYPRAFSTVTSASKAKGSWSTLDCVKIANDVACFQEDLEKVVTQSKASSDEGSQVRMHITVKVNDVISLAMFSHDPSGPQENHAILNTTADISPNVCSQCHPVLYLSIDSFFFPALNLIVRTSRLCNPSTRDLYVMWCVILAS